MSSQNEVRNDRQRSTARVLMAALTAVACGPESQPCLAYACNTTVSLSYALPRETPTGEFDVRICHGETCEDSVLTLSEAMELPCAGGDGAIVCVDPEGGGLTFHAAWTLNEGVPHEKTFRLRIVDLADGAILLDEAREAQFEESPWDDHCHDCWMASIEFDTPGSAGHGDRASEASARPIGPRSTHERKSRVCSSGSNQ